MGHQSKREVAPSPFQASPFRSLLAPWWGSATTSGVPFPATPSSSEAMPAPPVWWTAPPPQTNLVAGAAHGPFWGAVPPHSHGPYPSMNDGWKSDSLERPPGGFLSFLQNGNGNVSYPAPPSSMSRVDAASGSNAATAINIDDSTDVRTEKRLAWTPEEQKRLVSAWVRHSNDPINGTCKKKLISIGEMYLQSMT